MSRKRVIATHDITHRELRKIARLAMAQGWAIYKRNNGHLAWESPQGGTVYTAATPSDHRAVGKIISNLRKYGLEDAKVKQL